MENKIPVRSFFHSDEVKKGGAFLARFNIGKGYAAFAEKQGKTLDTSVFAVLTGGTGKPSGSVAEQIYFLLYIW